MNWFNAEKTLKPITNKEHIEIHGQIPLMKLNVLKSRSKSQNKSFFYNYEKLILEEYGKEFKKDFDKEFIKLLKDKTKSVINLPNHLFEM